MDAARDGCGKGKGSAGGMQNDGRQGRRDLGGLPKCTGVRVSEDLECEKRGSSCANGGERAGEEYQVEARKADRTQQKAATACLSTQLTLLRNSVY